MKNKTKSSVKYTQNNFYKLRTVNKLKIEKLQSSQKKRLIGRSFSIVGLGLAAVIILKSTNNLRLT